MTDLERFPLGTPLRPSPAFVPWFIIDFVLFALLILCCTAFPLLLSDTGAPLAGAAALGIFVLALLLFATWTRLYYQSMSYELHDDEMRW